MEMRLREAESVKYAIKRILKPHELSPSYKIVQHVKNCFARDSKGL